jgi:protein arginine phosphatase
MDVTALQPGGLEQAEQTTARAAEVFASGGLVVFPTETVYGIGASIASPEGYAALRAFKGRPDTQPFTVHIPSPAAAERYIDLSNPSVRRLIRKAMPGPITLVVDVPEAVIAEKVRKLGVAGDPGEVRSRLYHGHTIGLRCPDDMLAQRILGSVPDPVVASSANRRGDAPPHDADSAAAAVGDAAALFVDGGRSRYSKPSTIVRVKEGERGPIITVEREGVFDERYIRKLLRWTMLLVCSGNTCRSPMAEAIAKDMLSKERGVPVGELESRGVRVLSAGAFAMPGGPPSPEAVEALAKFGIDMAGHRSRTLTLDLVREADVIYCMTEAHRAAVVATDPSADQKTTLLDPSGDIEDPIGAGLTVYQRCAEIIRRRLEQRLKEQRP